MHANSSPIVSNQTEIHDHLERMVAKHAATRFLKPVAPYSKTAFETSIAAWRAAGEAPLILDAGCGTGASTLKLADCFPKHFVIGVDQSEDRLARNVTWRGEIPANFIKVRADLADYWRLMQGAGVGPDRHYLFYPNPWPKKHHVGRRWHGHPAFPTVVALGGYFECRSNWRVYIDECAAALRQLTAIDVQTEAHLPGDPALHAGLAGSSGVLANAMTPFEDKYLASGHTLWRCRVQIPAGT